MWQHLFWFLITLLSDLTLPMAKIRALSDKKMANRLLKHLKKSVFSKSARGMIYFWAFSIKGIYMDYQKPSPDITHGPRPWPWPSPWAEIVGNSGKWPFGLWWGCLYPSVYHLYEISEISTSNVLLCTAHLQCQQSQQCCTMRLRRELVRVLNDRHFIDVYAGT